MQREHFESMSLWIPLIVSKDVGNPYIYEINMIHDVASLQNSLFWAIELALEVGDYHLNELWWSNEIMNIVIEKELVSINLLAKHLFK